MDAPGSSNGGQSRRVVLPTVVAKIEEVDPPSTHIKPRPVCVVRPTPRVRQGAAQGGTVPSVANLGSGAYQWPDPPGTTTSRTIGPSSYRGRQRSPRRASRASAQCPSRRPRRPELVIAGDYVMDMQSANNTRRGHRLSMEEEDELALLQALTLCFRLEPYLSEQQPAASAASEEEDWG